MDQASRRKTRQGRERGSRRGAAFTLVELIAVIAMMLILVALSLPAFHSMQEAAQLTQATAQIAAILEESRAYAMTHRTYVQVGFEEVDASRPQETLPQEEGVGRVIVAVVASRDGTRGYELWDPASEGLPNAAAARSENLMLLGKIHPFENLHMAASLGATPKNGPMGMEAGRHDIGRFYRLGHPDCRSITPFEYPLGAGGAAPRKYRFSKVIQFDPQGVARIQYASNGDEIKEWMEIGLQGARGNTAPSAPSDPNQGNQAALQIDCMTGNIRIFRP